VDEFSKKLAKLASSEEFPLAKSENNGPNELKLLVRGKKTLARLANGFVFLLAKSEFYSHWASWRLVMAPLVIAIVPDLHV
jgi:hypothetical protein